MNTLILTKARLTSSGLLSRAYLSDLKKRDQLWLLPIAGAGIAAGAAVFMFMLIGNYRSILILGLNIRQPEITMLISGILSSVLLFFIGTPLCLSNVFYSKDNKLIVPLPVTTAEIAASRLINIYLFLLPVHLFLNIPAVALYFSAMGISAGGIIAAAALFIFGPLFSLTAALIASALLSAAADLSGRRMLFEIIGMSAAIVLLGGAQLSLSRSFISGGDFSRLSEMLTEHLHLLRKICFLSDWSSRGFRAGNSFFTLAGTAGSVSITAGAFLLMKNIIINLTDPHEKTAKKKRRRSSGPACPPKLSPAGSQTAALVKREWSIICSNSSFLMEVIGEVAVLPIIMLVFYLTIPRDYLSMLSETAAALPMLPLVVLGALILFSSINSVSATSISREGPAFMLSKALPVSGACQVRAKLIFSLILFLPAWYLNMTILMMVLKIPPANLVYLLPAGPAVIILGFITGIHIDLGRPVLGWNHPQQAMKQNMNVPLNMGFSILITGVLSGTGILLNLAGIYVLPAGLIAAALAGAADFLFIPRLFNYADRRYGEISV